MKRILESPQGRQVVHSAGDWSLSHLPRMALILLFAYLISRTGKRLLRRFQRSVQAQDVKAGRGAYRSVTLASASSNFLGAIVWTIALLQIMGELDIKLGPLVAGAGIVGAALGFGAQSLVKDFLTGFFVLLEDQYRVGDLIQVGDLSGTVERFSLRLTSIRSLDGSLHHISNGEIKTVSNSSSGWAKAIVDIKVPHTEKLSRLHGALERAGKDLAKEQEGPGRLVLETPKVLGVEDISDLYMQIRVAVTTMPGKQRPAARAYRERVKAVFEEFGIELAPPASVLVRAGGPAETEASTEAEKAPV